jgi:hypothetical protein
MYNFLHLHHLWARTAVRTGTIGWLHTRTRRTKKKKKKSVALQALTNLGRLSSRRWQSFPTAPDGTVLTCGQHIESHSCMFSFLAKSNTGMEIKFQAFFNSTQDGGQRSASRLFRFIPGTSLIAGSQSCFDKAIPR